MHFHCTPSTLISGLTAKFWLLMPGSLDPYYIFRVIAYARRLE